MRALVFTPLCFTTCRKNDTINQHFALQTCHDDLQCFPAKAHNHDHINIAVEMLPIIRPDELALVFGLESTGGDLNSQNNDDDVKLWNR